MFSRMFSYFRLALALAVLAFAPASMPAAQGNPPAARQPVGPVKIIFDTDMGNDVDDALALAAIHAIQSRGICELLAVTLTCPDPLSVEYVAAVNTFYGRPGIPVGINPDSPSAMSKTQRFLDIMRRVKPDGSPVFTHNTDTSKSPRALTLLRRTLANADNGSVDIIQVGFSTNLSLLLDSPADDISPLTGRELVQRKVRQLTLMAGNFAPPAPGKPPHIEFNIRWDIPAARNLTASWPTPVAWSGYEVGWVVRFPAWSIDHDFACHPRHIIKDSYQLFEPTPHERPCWDPTAVIAAIWPERGYFDRVKGRVSIDEKGISTFEPGEAGRDFLLKVNQSQIDRLRELLAALVSQPPRGCKRKQD